MREEMRGGGWVVRQGKREARVLNWVQETPWRGDDLIGQGNAKEMSSGDAQERGPPWDALDFLEEDYELKQTQIHGLA